MIETYLTDREALYFFFLPGCAACEAAEPEIERFIARHQDMMILRLNANGPMPGRLGMKIAVTPTYVFRRGDQAIVHVGTMTAAQIEKWLKKRIAA